MTEQLSTSEVGQLRRELAAVSVEIAKIEVAIGATFERMAVEINEFTEKVEGAAHSLASVATSLESLTQRMTRSLSVSTTAADGLGSAIRKVGDVGSTILGLVPAGGAVWAAGFQLATEAAGALADAISNIPTTDAQVTAIQEYRNALNAASMDASALNETMVAASRARLEEQERSLNFAVLLTRITKGLSSFSYDEGLVPADPAIMARAQADAEAYQQQLSRVQLALAGVVPPVVDLNNVHVDLAPSIAQVSTAMADYTEKVNAQARAAENLIIFEQLRAEASATANAELKDALGDLVRVETKRQDTEREAAADYISNMEKEIDVLSLRLARQDEAAGKLQLEHELLKTLGASYRVNAEKIAELVKKREDLNGKIVEQKKAEEELNAATKKAAADWKAIWDRAEESFGNALGDSFEAIINGKIKSVGDVVKQFAATGSSLVKDLVGSKAKDALGGLLSSFSSFSGPLGGAIGSAAGALAGKAINAFAKALGGKPSDKIEATTFDIASGYRVENDLGRGKDSPENRALAVEIENQIRQVNDAFVKAGLSSSATSFMLEVGSGSSLAPFRGSVNGGGVQSFQTKDQMLAFFTQQIVGGLQEVPAKLQEYINGIDYTNVEKFVSAVERISAFKEGMEGIHDQLLKIADPKAWDLQQVDNEFKGILEQANLMGSDQDIADINRLIGIRRSGVERQYDGFDDKLQSVKDENAQMDRENAAKGMDPQQWDLTELEKWYQDMRALAIKHGEGMSDIEALYGKRRTQITEKYAAEAAAKAEQAAAELAAKAEQAAAEQAARQQDIMNRVMEQARGTISSRLDALAEERRVIEENASKYRSILDSIKSVQARFASDPRISPVSNQQRLADLMAELNAAYAKAQSGDDEAAAEVANLAMAAAEANVAYNASSEEAAAIQSQIATILSNTRSLANSELQIAQFNLDANEAQVDLLQQLLDKMGAPGASPPTTIDDLNALMAEFGKANATYNFSGMKEDQIKNHPVWLAFEAELFDTINRLAKSGATVAWLQDSLKWASTEYGTEFDFAAKRRVPVLQKRLADFGIPGFARGGRTGNLAIVHPNEMIYTGPPAMVYNARETASMMSGGNVLRELQGIRADIGVLSRTVSISGEDQVAQLSRHDMRLAAIESNFSLARARA